jgi:hypothetical protein
MTFSQHLSTLSTSSFCEIKAIYIHLYPLIHQIPTLLNSLVIKIVSKLPTLNLFAHQKSSKIIKIPKVLISFGHEIPFTAHFSSFFMAKTSPSWPLLASHLASHLELKGLRRRSGVAESQGSGDDAEPDLAMAGYG